MADLNSFFVKLGLDGKEFVLGLNNASKSLNQFSAQVKSFGAGFAASMGFATLSSAVGKAVEDMAEFQHSMQTVKVLTGAVGDEFDRLRDNAINLSGAVSAIDISKMEADLSRLGFSTDEILNVTKAVIDLSVATGTDLPKAAEIAGSTMRAFQLHSSEMGHITDVMGASFNNTALDITSFSESMKYVAPNAAAAGISLEETTAMLGVLANNGIKGSMAGTALRRIIQDLAKDSRPLSDRLAELNQRGLSASESFDEVGRIASTAFLILSKGSDNIQQLKRDFIDANGVMAENARLMQDDLTGDWNKLTAAIQRFQNDSAGPVLGTLRLITQHFTSWVNVVDEHPWLLVGQGNPFMAGVNLAFEKFLGYTDEAKKKLEALDKASFGYVEENIQSKGSGSNLPLWERLRIQAEEAKKAADEAYKTSHQRALDQNNNTYGLPGLLDDNTRARVQSLFDNNLPTVSMAKDTFSLLGNGPQDLTEHFKELSNVVSNTDRVFKGFHLTNQMLGRTFIQMGDQISNGLASAISGMMPFAQAMSQMALSVVDSLERIALARIIESATEGSLGNPIAAVAGAIAGFTAIKALFMSIGKNSGSGGSSPSISRSALQNNQLTGTVVLRGQDLAIVMSQYNQQAGYTKPS